MRHSLAISAVALAIASLATPGEAQTRNGSQQRGFSGAPQNGGFSQRSIQGPTNNSGGNFGNRSFRTVQPPAPGNRVVNTGNRSFRTVQPPAPGNQAGNQTGNARSFSIQPPPAGGAARSAQPPIGNSIQPPIASPTIPTATATAATVGAVAATAAVSTSARAQRAPIGDQTASVGQPIDPSANTNLPPLEMLASVGEPIMPLEQAPTGAVEPTAGATRVVRSVEPRVIRSAVVVESCGVPVHHVTHYRSYRRW